MKIHIWISCCVFLVVLLQANCKLTDPKANLIGLQEKVEQLIEKVLTIVQDYYYETHSECLPEDVPEKVIESVKKAIDCVEASHNQYTEGRIEYRRHRREFLRCFVKAKTEIGNLMQKVDTKVNHCPRNVTEKTFQINVTTSYTKTFNVNIKNGLDVVENKTIEVTRNEERCQNYPDVFSLDEDEGEKDKVTTKQPEATLTHREPVQQTKNDGFWVYHPPGGIVNDDSTTQHPVPDDATTAYIIGSADAADETTQNLNNLPKNNRSSSKVKEDMAYSYFQEFKSGEDDSDDSSQSVEYGEQSILQQLLNRNLRSRYPEVNGQHPVQTEKNSIKRVPMGTY